ncbi:hypothetical protein Lfu02_70770 [Longispora fulva]|uniref:2-haloacid dehalogenase/putative hydrolase of the HAD superfamily n=1 Tax=Longispora fulva TaxID=619741 RepID=A0A8J7G7K6_9ACTN|nr:HAD family hydrolase [Longispora fulva]MBG6134380.1 2-haloacid dehalogenase/putative hydrolase of the HAD superfamily [Longispora fulva]GIG62705.1 hypothetical protein Lfu02_70770 [Longispora fulva]
MRRPHVTGGRDPIRGVLLDFYGTLVAEDDHIIEAIHDQVLATARHPETVTTAEVGTVWWSAFQELAARSHGGSFRTQRDIAVSSLADTLRHVGSTADPLEVCRPQFAYWRQPDLLPDTLAFLGALDVPVCVVSNIDRGDLLAALEHTGLSFEHIVTSEDARSYKPRPECFLAALDVLGLRPDEVVHVGDSLSGDVTGASRLGIPIAWINRRGRTLPEGRSVTHDLPGLAPLPAIIAAGR